MACGQGNYPVTLEEFKAYYLNDFDFSVITDIQITLMFDLACTQIKKVSSCLLKMGAYPFAFMALSAYYLFKQYGNGKEDGDGEDGKVGIISSESQDDVSLSYTIPDKFMKSPFFYFFTSNKYGMDYLQIIYPCLSGQGMGNTLNVLRRCPHE